MQVIGFNFTKIRAERSEKFKHGAAINTDIQFLNIEKEEIPLLKDKEAIKISFDYTISYLESKEKKTPKEAEICFTGTIIMSSEKDEAKEILKAWKKKEIPAGFRMAIFNIILKKCASKALQIEDELNLPYHLPMPQLRPEAQQEQAPSK